MRLIDANTMYDCKTCYHDSSGKCQLGIFGCDHGEAYRPAFSKMEIVDAEPMRHGQWGNYDEYNDGYRCSRCKLIHRTATKFCPHCGAKMDGNK